MLRVAVSEDILLKITKLLSVHGRTPQESATYAAKAQELMLKYGIEQSELSEFKTPDKKHVAEKKATFEGRYKGKDLDLWKYWMPLFSTVSRTSLCRALFHGESKFKGYAFGYQARFSKEYTSATFIGRKVDIEAAQMLFQYLTTEIFDQWMVFCTRKDNHYDSLRSYKERGYKYAAIKATWFSGAVKGASDVLEAQFVQRQAEYNTTTALIIVRDTEIKEYMDETYGVLRGGVRTNANLQSGGAYDAGVRAGMSAASNRNVKLPR